jgi:hypothetical protein
VVDDDTYVKVPQFYAALVARGDPSRAVAAGRKFLHATKGSLLGGGPGIALSRGAVAAIRDAHCTQAAFPVISHTVPGGDGWLGQCMTLAEVTRARVGERQLPKMRVCARALGFSHAPLSL